MDFFEHQAIAKRKSIGLLFHFFWALAVIVLFINSLVYGLVYLPMTGKNFQQWLAHPLCHHTAAITTGMIMIGSMIRWWKIRGNGQRVATYIGATPIQEIPKSKPIKQLLNITEEMSIAAGMPMPHLYVLEQEQGINALVAGTDPNHTALIVTSGLLKHLNRDQVQGVIAHEFSHIFHGDMALNLKLMSLLGGILAIGQMGEFLMGVRVRHLHNRAMTRGKEHNLLMIFGIFLWLLGYIGLLLGRLIKSSISRQREFLADAAAVQYTRNPEGIAGALYEISTNPEGSGLINLHAEEINHMCIADSRILIFFRSLLDSHPPLLERIKRIDQRFLAKMRVRKRKEQQSAQHNSTTTQSLGTNHHATANHIFATSSVIETIGNPDAIHFMQASVILNRIPSLFKPEHEQYNPKIATWVTLLPKDQYARLEVLETIKAQLHDNEYKNLHATHQIIPYAFNELKLSIVQLAIPALKQLQSTEQDQFLLICRILIKADQKLSLFEFSCLILLQHCLHQGITDKQHNTITLFKNVKSEIELLLKTLISCGKQPQEDQIALYEKLIANFFKDAKLYTIIQIKPNYLGLALDKLRRLSPLLKKPIIETLIEAIIKDHQVTQQQSDMLRVICEILECPIPPIHSTY